MNLIPKLKRVTRRREGTGSRTCDEAAYLALEEARLVCERQDSADQGQSDRLRLLHRQLGMAGFHVSCELPPIRRRKLLELARARSEKRSATAVDVAPSIATLTRDARSAIEGAMRALGPRDELHLAHLYVLCAVELLAAWSRPFEAVKPGAQAA